MAIPIVVFGVFVSTASGLKVTRVKDAAGQLVGDVITRTDGRAPSAGDRVYVRGLLLQDFNFTKEPDNA